MCRDRIHRLGRIHRLSFSVTALIVSQIKMVHNISKWYSGIYQVPPSLNKFEWRSVAHVVLSSAAGVDLLTTGLEPAPALANLALA